MSQIQSARSGIRRRSMMLGLASVGTFSAVAGHVRAAGAVAQAPLLSGTDFSLEIGPVPMNVTGRSRTAIGINGQVPAPILRWRQGDTVTLAVTNRLEHPSSIHWHGLRVPSPMDGVPGLSFNGIAPGQTFVYRFPVHDSGTFWYHSHSGLQEQRGLYGPIVVEPHDGYAEPFDRDYVVLLSDWSDEDPETIVSNLKFQSDYYNYGQRTLGTFFSDISRHGLVSTVSDRLAWGRMRMSPTDILDVTGATYTYLVNGHAPDANWTALFRPGERIRLRFINGSAMSIFDVRIPGLPMTVVQADGNDVEPVTIDEFRIGTAETYDVIVHPTDARAFTVFAQAQDRSGYARGTLAPRAGMTAPIPAMDPRPLRTMADMGMGNMDMGHGTMAPASAGTRNGAAMAGASMPGTAHGSMDMTLGSMAMAAPDRAGAGTGVARGAASGAAGGAMLQPGIEVDNVAMMPAERLSDPGGGLEHNGRRVLTYADLRASRPGDDPREPSREIVLHLTGNMERFIWGFDGKKFSEAEPIMLKRGERVRFILINDTMMEHPIHLHGLWSELENRHGAFRPYKHTLLVKPGERLSFLVNADEPGRWAFHCHLLYHMHLGMFREVRVA